MVCLPITPLNYFLSCHCRKDESARLQQVVQHPEFQNDPLAAITSHLSATLPPPPPAPRPKMDKKQRKLEKKRRAQMAKANAASNDMAE